MARHSLTLAGAICPSMGRSLLVTALVQHPPHTTLVLMFRGLIR